MKLIPSDIAVKYHVQYRCDKHKLARRLLIQRWMWERKEKADSTTSACHVIGKICLGVVFWVFNILITVHVEVNNSLRGKMFAFEMITSRLLIFLVYKRSEVWATSECFWRQNFNRKLWNDISTRQPPLNSQSVQFHISSISLDKVHATPTTDGKQKLRSTHVRVIPIDTFFVVFSSLSSRRRTGKSQWGENLFELSCFYPHFTRGKRKFQKLMTIFFRPSLHLITGWHSVWHISREIELSSTFKRRSCENKDLLKDLFVFRQSQLHKFPFFVVRWFHVDFQEKIFAIMKEIWNANLLFNVNGRMRVEWMSVNSGLLRNQFVNLPSGECSLLCIRKIFRSFKSSSGYFEVRALKRN